MDIDFTDRAPPDMIRVIGATVDRAWPEIGNLEARIAAEIETRLHDGGEEKWVDLTTPELGRIRLVRRHKNYRDDIAAACRDLPGPLCVDLRALPMGDAVETLMAVMLGLYRFDRYKTQRQKSPRADRLSVVATDPAAARNGFHERRALLDSILFARDLVSEPPNILYPEAFAARMEALAELGVVVETIDSQKMRELGMGALLAVGQGSRRDSRLAVMHWDGGRANEAPVALVGKGVCFDTGGISLKAGENMDQMKWDMGGAAAVAGAIRALAASKAPVKAVGILGLVENMPDGDAYRPGDVLTSMSGKTIEVINTDAEGRLVLADAITYCQRRFAPSAIVDIATLTSAVDIALGKETAGFFANDEALANDLAAAGAISGDTVWRLPLIESYDHLMDSDVADMKNLSDRSAGAGAITAALFLQRFVEAGRPWAHVDMAGLAWRKNSRRGSIPSGATGFGVALLERFVRSRFASAS